MAGVEMAGVEMAGVEMAGVEMAGVETAGVEMAVGEMAVGEMAAEGSEAEREAADLACEHTHTRARGYGTRSDGGVGREVRKHAWVGAGERGERQLEAQGPRVRR
jgi:hypothetical protein